MAPFEPSENLLLVWTVILVVELASKLILRHLNAPREEERATHATMREVKINIRKHRGPEAFVAKTKLERQLITLEKDAAVHKEARSARKALWGGHLSKAKHCVSALLVVYHWQTPLYMVPAWGLWPLGWLFAFPGHPTGSVGVIAGVIVSQFGASRVLSFFL